MRFLGVELRRAAAAQRLEIVAPLEGIVQVMGDFRQFLNGLTVDVEFVGVEMNFGQLIILSLGVKLNLVLAIPETTHLVHSGVVLLQRFLPHELQSLPLLLLSQAHFRFVFHLRDGS